MTKQEGEDSAARFAAYGVTAHGDDPISKALHKLIDHAAQQEQQILNLQLALKQAGIACAERDLRDEFDPDQLNKMVD
jgi:serine O-acetyltransferase